MERMNDMGRLRFLSFAENLYKNKYLQAIRHSFFMVMPFLLAVSLLDAAESILLDPWGIVMGYQGLNLGFWITGGLSGDAYRQSGAVQFLISCRSVISVGYGILSLLLAMSIAGRLARIWESGRRMTILCAAASFLFLLPLPADLGSGLVDYFSERRFFSAFFVGFASARLFSWLAERPSLRLPVPDSMPRRLSPYLAQSPAVLLTLLAFAVASRLLMLLQAAGAEHLAGMASCPLFQHPLFALLYQLVVWTLWWLGIPGYGFTSMLQSAVYVPAQAGNQLGNTAAIFTSGFFEAGIMHVLGLAIAILVFSRHETWRSVTKFSLPILAFNVQEPFLFGLPVVLNPVFAIPYVLAPLANTLVGWVAISWGIVPVFHATVPWTMPLLLNATWGTQSFMGGVLQAVWLVMDIFIYAPFVITANMMDFRNESEPGDEDGDGA